jgi:hypothetical protein
MSRICALALVCAMAMPASVWASECRREHRNLCREKKIGGGVALGLGIAGLGVGIGLLTQPNRPVDRLPAYERSYRGPGAAVTGLGVLLLVTGIALLVDAIRTERGRKRARGSRAR